MKNLYNLFIIAAILLFFSFQSNAQITSKGNDFWLGFMENYTGGNNFYVFLSSDVAASGTVSIPGAGWSQNFTLSPNTAITIDIPYSSAVNQGSETVKNTGVHVTSDTLINCFAMNYKVYTTDGTLVLPVAALGTEYYVLCYGPQIYTSEFLIVAVENNTTVQITPKATTSGGKPANVPFTITLNKGQIYQVQSSGDLSGSHIVSANGTTKFAVFAGNVCANIPSGVIACDHLYEQMFPVRTWRTKYVAVPYKTRKNDSYRILASRNGTQVSINGAVVTNLSAGQFYDTQFGTPSIISANNPIEVAQYSQGTGADGVEGDPFFIMLSPVDQTREDISFIVFNFANIKNDYVNIATKTTCINNLLLDGNPIAANFNTVPSDPSFSYAQINVTKGAHRLTSNSPGCGFNAYVYGFGPTDSYGYSAGVRLDPLTIALVINTNCAGNPTQFYVRSQPFTIKNYNWNFGDGGTSTQSNPSHIYQNGGNYNVRLIVTYEDNSKDTAEQIFTIEEPKAKINYIGGGCLDSIVTFRDLSTVVGGSIVYRHWVFGDGDTSNQANPTHAYKTKGKFRVILTITSSSGCIDRDTVFVDIFPRPRARAGANKEICLYDSVQIGEPATDGTPPYTYLWQPSTGLSADNIAQPIASPQSVTRYIVLVTDKNGCTDRDTVFVNVNPLPIANAGNDDTLCLGASIQIGGITNGGTPPYSFNWTPSTGLSAANVQYPQATPNSTTKYYLTVTDSKGCKSVDSVIITVYPQPQAVAGNDIEICNGSSVTIGEPASGGKPPYSYLWSPPQNLSATDIAQPIASPTSTTSYILTVTDANGCVARDTVLITVNPLPIADAGQDASICLGQSIQIGNPAAGGTPPYNYLWSPSTGLSATDQAIVTANPPDTTTYILKVTDAKGCVDFDTVKINIIFIPKPIISKSGPTTFCNCDSVVLDAGNINYIAYLWSTGETTREITVKTEGRYYVTITNIDGCKNTSDTLDIFVRQPSATIGFPQTTIEVEPGEQFKIPLLILNSEYLDFCRIFNFDATISFNKSIMVPFGTTPKGTIDFINNRRTIQLTGTRKGGDTILLNSDFLATLGDTETSSLDLDIFNWHECPFNVNILNSNLRLKNLCKEGGVTRLFISPPPTVKLSIKPHPVRDIASIDYSISSEANIRIYLLDILGVKICELYSGFVSIGEHSLEIDTKNYSTGTYNIILETPWGATTKQIQIIK